MSGRGEEEEGQDKFTIVSICVVAGKIKLNDVCVCILTFLKNECLLRKMYDMKSKTNNTMA